MVLLGVTIVNTLCVYKIDSTPKLMTFTYVAVATACCVGGEDGALDSTAEGAVGEVLLGLLPVE